MLQRMPPEATQEGNCGYLLRGSRSAFIPLYRTRSVQDGAHFYTAYIDERDVAINEKGYVGEGIACYAMIYPWPFAPEANWSPIIPLYRPTTAYRTITSIRRVRRSCWPRTDMSQRAWPALCRSRGAGQRASAGRIGAARSGISRHPGPVVRSRHTEIRRRSIRKQA
jgi:hypothetical protein